MESSPRPKPRPPEPSFSITFDDLEKIERVVNAEAGNEGLEGRDAVRGVILNRLASDRFGNTIDEVLTADQFEPVRKYGSVSEIPVDQSDLDLGIQELVDYIQLGQDASDGRVFFQNEEVTKKRGSFFEGTNPLKIGSHTFYDGLEGQEPVTMTELLGSHNIRFIDDLASLSIPEMRLGGLMEARKGITTEAGSQMAKKKFQLDEKKADLDKDGKLSDYERNRGEAVQKAIKANMYHGGMAYGDDSIDPVSGNPIPLGSSAENVRDDISIMISEGEYVLPANVVKWHGLKHIMDMQSEAEMGLMSMHEMGLIQEVDPVGMETCPECDGEGCEHCEFKGYHESEPSGEGSEDTEVQAADDTEQEETEEYETPQGNEVEMVEGTNVEEMDHEYSNPEEDEDYYPKKVNTQLFGMMKKPTIKFIV